MDQTAYFEQMRQKRREEILACARGMILAEGPASVTMQKLARALDISNVTLYKYFKNLEDIFHTLQQEISRPCAGWLRFHPDGSSPLKQFLENYRFLCDEMLERREDLSLMVLLSLYEKREDPSRLTEERTPSGAFSGLAEFRRAQLQLLRKAYENGLTAGEYSAEETVEFLDTLLFSFLEHAALLSPREYEAKKPEIRRQSLQLSRLFAAYFSQPVHSQPVHPPGE